MIKIFVAIVKRLWRNSKFNKVRDPEELERLGVLQQIAWNYRKEYATELKRCGVADYMCRAAVEARKKMNKAETAHTAALRDWENRGSRQKSY